MPDVLLIVAVIIALFGLTKATRTARCGEAPWRSLLVWAVLLGVGLSVWLLSARIPMLSN